MIKYRMLPLPNPNGSD